MPDKTQIKKGSRVLIETKENQGTGNLIGGIVEKILTSSDSHPYGIKVRLQDGQIGRVKKIGTVQDSKSNQQPDVFEDLEHKEIPSIEDKYSEFKEFYQYDDIMDRLSADPASKKNIIIKKKKREVQERFATAICSFGNKDGGFVYLGIQSDGGVTGLEKDRILENFANYDDEFANHIQSRLNELIQDNAFILTKFNMIFRQIGDKTICMIQILPSDRPLYLHSDRGKEFYVRGIAPRAHRLDGIEEARYIKERFSNLQ